MVDSSRDKTDSIYHPHHLIFYRHMVLCGICNKTVCMVGERVMKKFDPQTNYTL
mgnify:CR=1 FL=1